MIWLPDERFLKDTSIIFAFGAARSGKTILAQIASSFNGVDHVDEYFPLLAISIAANNGQISPETFTSISKCMLSELQNASALLRFANFRPKDASSIFKYKSKREILERVIRLNSRDESAQFVKDVDYKLWMTSTDLNNCSKLFQNTFPNSPRVLILRHPIEVASEVVRKKWFSDQTLLESKSNTPTIKHYSHRLKVDLYLPWWLPEDEHSFWADSDEFTRALVYWKVMHSNYFNETKQEINFPTVITWNALLHTPRQVISKLEALLNKEATRKSYRIIKSINKYRLPNLKVTSPSEVVLQELQPMIKKFELTTK